MSERFSKHFNILFLEPFNAQSLTHIFGNITNWLLKNENKDFSKGIIGLSSKLVSSTIQIYFQVKESKELLPTPAKSHYQYNIRDISKVIQGLTLVLFLFSRTGWGVGTRTTSSVCGPTSVSGSSRTDSSTRTTSTFSRNSSNKSSRTPSTRTGPH